MLKRTILLTLTIALVMTMSVLSFSDENASSWARNAIDEAKENHLTTDAVLTNMKDNITRQEFCEVIINLYEEATHKAAYIPQAFPFSDTDNLSVLKAYGLDIVGGTGNGHFSPNAFITREQMAVMVVKSIKAIDSNVVIEGYDLSFSDSSEISSWAKSEVAYLAGNGLMGGVGNNNFSPSSNASKEMAVVLINNQLNQLPNIISVNQDSALEDEPTIDTSSQVVTFIDPFFEKYLRKEWTTLPSGTLTTKDLEVVTSLSIWNDYKDWGDKEIITSLEDLKWLPNIERLQLTGVYIEGSLESLTHLKKLTDLELNNTHIEGNISILSEIKPLAVLWLQSNPRLEGSLEDLSSLTSLIELNIQSNSESGFPEEDCIVGDISALKSLTQLQVLDLGYYVSGDISSLTGMNDLSALTINSYEVSGDISTFTKGFPSLYSLDLSNSNISGDLGVLNAVPTLDSLYVSGTMVTGSCTLPSGETVTNY